MPAFYDGSPIFGLSVRCVHMPQENAMQMAAFFGVNALQSIMGGTRGRIFQISGLFYGPLPIDCVTQELFLLSYADGIGRTLIDTTGVSWSNVIFSGLYSRQNNGQFGVLCDGSGYFCLPYSCVFKGVT